MARKWSKVTVTIEAEVEHYDWYTHDDVVEQVQNAIKSTTPTVAFDPKETIVTIAIE